MDFGKQQTFPYSFRTVAPINQLMCQNRYFLQITPPENALTIENLWTHVVITFDVSVAAANQQIASLGITDGVPLAIGTPATYQRRQTVNVAADANRIAEVKLDLTHLLKKNTPSCYIEVMLPIALQGVSTIGTFSIWKADGLYTTTGIR